MKITQRLALSVANYFGIPLVWYIDDLDQIPRLRRMRVADPHIPSAHQAKVWIWSNYSAMRYGLRGDGGIESKYDTGDRWSPANLAAEDAYLRATGEMRPLPSAD